MMTDQNDVRNVEEDVEDVQEDIEDVEEDVEDVQEDIEDVEEDVEDDQEDIEDVEDIEEDEEEEQEQESRGSRWWIWLIIALVVLSTMACLFFGGKALYGMFFVREEQIEQANPNPEPEDKLPVSWKDAVEYEIGGSGPPDPASELGTDMTAVDHAIRLITSNPDLDVLACFPAMSDEDWQEVVTWSDKWGSDSPTRIEWQVNESRCSWVFPGDITDDISEQDYEEILKILSDSGYSQTWFVSGTEGSEFGRETYTGIMSASTYINRVHVYGDTLPTMPVK